MGKKWIVTIDEITESGDFACKTSRTEEGSTPMELMVKVITALSVIAEKENEIAMNELKDKIYKRDDDVPF